LVVIILLVAKTPSSRKLSPPPFRPYGLASLRTDFLRSKGKGWGWGHKAWFNKTFQVSLPAIFLLFNKAGTLSQAKTWKVSINTVIY